MPADPTPLYLRDIQKATSPKRHVYPVIRAWSEKTTDGSGFSVAVGIGFTWERFGAFFKKKN